MPWYQIPIYCLSISYRDNLYMYHTKQNYEKTCTYCSTPYAQLNHLLSNGLGISLKQIESANKGGRPRYMIVPRSRSSLRLKQIGTKRIPSTSSYHSMTLSITTMCKPAATYMEAFYYRRDSFEMYNQHTNRNPFTRRSWEGIGRTIFHVDVPYSAP